MLDKDGSGVDEGKDEGLELGGGDGGGFELEGGGIEVDLCLDQVYIRKSTYEAYDGGGLGGIELEEDTGGGVEELEGGGWLVSEFALLDGPVGPAGPLLSLSARCKANDMLRQSILSV